MEGVRKNNGMMKKKKDYLPTRNILSYSARERKPKRTFKTFIILFITFLCITAFLVYLVFTADFLKVISFEVLGNRLLDPERVINAVAESISKKHPIAALINRENILFWVITNEKLSFSSPPELASVSIRTDIFERKVELVAKERDIIHIVCKTSEGKCYGITGEGFVFAEIPRVMGFLILQIEDASGNPVAVGEPYFDDPYFLSRIYDTTKILEAEGFAPHLIRVNEHELREWEAVLPSGIALYFSGTFIPRNLSDILNEVQKNGGINQYRYLDFRVEDKVFYQ